MPATEQQVILEQKVAESRTFHDEVYKGYISYMDIVTRSHCDIALAHYRLVREDRRVFENLTRSKSYDPEMEGVPHEDGEGIDMNKEKWAGSEETPLYPSRFFADQALSPPRIDEYVEYPRPRQYSEV